jgi:hypothetical protein
VLVIKGLAAGGLAAAAAWVIASGPAWTAVARTGAVPAPTPSATGACVPTAGSGADSGIPAIIATRDDLPGHTEPAIAVSRHDPRDLLGASEFVTPGQNPRLVPGAFSSSDGGRTWHDYGPLPLPPGYSHGDDVSAGFAGRAGFVAAEAYRAAGGSSVFVWRTTDGGRHFSAPANVFTAPTGAPNTDHPWLAVTSGHGVAVAWNWGDALMFSRSADEGVTFGAPQRISAPDDLHPNLAVVVPGPQDTISVMYQAIGSTSPGKGSTGGGPTTKVVTSVDGGLTFGQPYPLPPGTGYTFAAQPFASSLPTIAADPVTGTLYVAMSLSLLPGAPRSVVVYRSDDGGRSWSPAVTASAQDPRADEFQPSLTVDEAGTVYVSYLSYAAGRVNSVLVASANRAASFGAPVQLGQPFDPACGLIGVWKVSPWFGDYQGLTSGHGHVYAVWADTGTGRPEIAFAAVRARGAQRAGRP